MPFGRVLQVVLVVLATVLIAPAAQAQQPSPTASVERLHASLLDVMQQAGRLGYEGRLQSLAPVLNAVYDYGEMARVASGRHWKNFSPDQRRRLIDAFARMSAATYAARFDDYDGEGFTTTGTREAPGGGVLVRTRLLRPGADDVALDYLVKQGEEGWRIVDVYYMGGISEVANQRSQFLAVLRSGGVEELIRALEAKARQQATAP